jgi:hypothetical protein
MFFYGMCIDCLHPYVIFQLLVLCYIWCSLMYLNISFVPTFCDRSANAVWFQQCEIVYNRKLLPYWVRSYIVLDSLVLVYFTRTSSIMCFFFPLNKDKSGIAFYHISIIMVHKYQRLKHCISTKLNL